MSLYLGHWDAKVAIALKREKFIQQYVAQFLASYAASKYDSRCQNGWLDREQPVEDAELLAIEA